MGICGKVNQDQKICPENNSKIDPKTNQKKSPKTKEKILIDQENKKYKKNISNLPPLPPPLKLISEVYKSICRIIKENDTWSNERTGFFMKVNDSKEFLVTNYNLLAQGISNENILLKLSNEKVIRLNLKSRHIRYLPPPKDIALIEVKAADGIFNDIKFLNYDLNYTLGYEIYKNGYVFTVGFSNGKAIVGSGKIVDIKDYVFYHNIDIDSDVSGCPIMLLNFNLNIISVIGIHMNLNYGTFIAEIFINPEKKRETDDKCIIQFISGDQHVNMFITCQTNDNFLILEEKLYSDFPDLKNKNIIFLANGNIIDRFITLEENRIGNDTTIIIQEM